MIDHEILEWEHVPINAGQPGTMLRMSPADSCQALNLRAGDGLNHQTGCERRALVSSGPMQGGGSSVPVNPPKKEKVRSFDVV
jgi:hypothetical protein